MANGLMPFLTKMYLYWNLTHIASLDQCQILATVYLSTSSCPRVFDIVKVCPLATESADN